MVNKDLPVLVTGASGYIAGWIIKYLLEEGYTVHGTVRNPNKTDSVAHLQRIAANAPGTLKLFKADLLDKGSFHAAAEGCGVVMHTASPFIIEGFTDANAALVQPAVDGTRNVLEAVNAASTVTRVVLTSSVAAVFGDNIDLQKVESGKFSEADWNTTSTVDHNPYQYSKVAAERAAWDICKTQNRWDMVTINPSMVYGPALTSNSQSASIDTLRQMGDGRLRTGVPRLLYGVVDVRDVAKAHVLAAFTPSASGRYIVSNTELSMLEIARILKNHFGGKYPFPRMEVPKLMVWLVGPLMGPVTRDFISKNVGLPLRINNSRGRNELGLTYIPVEQTFKEHFQQILDDGLVKQR